MNSFDDGSEVITFIMCKPISRRLSIVAHDFYCKQVSFNDLVISVFLFRVSTNAA